MTINTYVFDNFPKRNLGEHLNYEYRVNHFSKPDRLIDFLREYWRADHVFVRCPELFDWQHRDPISGTYNFATAHDLEDKDRLVAILGYIPFSQFDSQLKNDEYAVAIWKVVEDIKGGGVGLELFRALLRLRVPYLAYALGVNPRVMPIYERKLHFSSGRMSHFVIFNPQMRPESRRISLTPPGFSPSPLRQNGKSKLREVNFEEAELNRIGSYSRLLAERQPRKSLQYYLNRYGRHPFYRYRAFIISSSGEDVGLVIMRQLEREGQKILRIVDYLGEEPTFCNIAPCFQQLIIDENCEYLDVYLFGFDCAHLEEAGFVNREKIEGLVVPNYFEPFIKENIEIDLTYKVAAPNKLVFFRGDSDQDRPSAVAKL